MRKRATAVAWLSAVVAAAIGGSLVVASASAQGQTNVAVVAPEGPVVHAGRWMVDRTGRVVIIHGVNMPSKELPAYPAALGFSDDDATLLASSGLNAVRLTVERYAVEPAPGRFDDAYVAHIADTVAMLNRHGILSLIDFHQDEYGPVFNDNGFPAWMTSTDGLPNLTQVGFPGQYFLNPALNRAFDHFWANDIGPSGRPVQADDAAILAHVASHLAGQAGLLGYEIMNEPWPGTKYPTCVVPAVGCPVFDRGPYSAYYARAIAAVRAADPAHMVWYEPLTTFNQGVPTSMVPPADPRLGFAFHDYPLCSSVAGAAGASAPSAMGSPCATEDAMVLSNAEAHSAATGNALLETEFGASKDLAALSQQLGQYDQHMIPWMFWSYTRYIDAYASNGTLAPPTRANVNEAMLSTLARPYPQLVAGTPIAWGFDPDTKTFALRYSTDRAAGHGTFPPGSETDISVPALAYPRGYVAAVAGGTVVSRPDAPILRVRATPGHGHITVSVAPTGAATHANSTCPTGATPVAAGVSVYRSGTPTGGQGQLTTCITGTSVADGTVTAGSNSAKGTYVVDDGRPTNPNLANGYIGVDRQDALTVVGCNSGDYNPNAPDDWNQTPTSKDNNAIASLGRSTYTAPSGPVGPTSPCSPKPYSPGPHGRCGSAQDTSPASTYPGGASPLNIYTSASGAPNPNRSGDVGVAGSVGGRDVTNGYLQGTYGPGSTGPQGNVTFGGTSKGGGGTAAAGNDGKETGDTFTPPGTPVAVCQN